MSEINDGGHAFPNITPDMQVDGGPGMSLRDYFAAKAMQGMLASDWQYQHIDDVGKHSYQIAASMLKARRAVAASGTPEQHLTTAASDVAQK